MRTSVIVSTIRVKLKMDLKKNVRGQDKYVQRKY